MPADHRPTILVIDDKPQNVSLLKSQLERVGYTVHSATSGEEGLAQAAASPPDLILLDIMMPGMDGYEVCSRLKADQATRPVPVLMLTSLSERADKIRALDVGADDFLSRPADRAELLARVRSLLRMKDLYDQLVLSRDETTRQAEVVAAEKSRLEAILHSMSDGVLTTDLERRITSLNPAAETIARVPAERALGQPWITALGVRDRGGHPLGTDACPLARVLRTGATVGPSELVLWRPDEQEVVISLTAAPIRRADGQTSGVVAVFRDVTRQREIERLKDEFVSLVSHELRTPLASVFGFSELLLLHENLSQQGRSFAQSIHSEAQRLAELVNDFLDLERLESGQISYHPRTIRLDDLLVEVERSFLTQLAGHRLIRELPAEPVMVRADAQRLRQVLTNLISNAIKYSPRGGDVRISAAVEGDSVVISVTDHGLGIPAPAMDRLFTKFYRIEGPEHAQVGGTGLGLAICKRLVEGWGGRIWAESPGLGQGSTFCVTVPRANGSDASPVRRARPRARGRILLVKDDPSLTALIREQLSEAGYEVDSVATGEAAIAHIQAERPAAVVLDLGLSGQLDGWSVLRFLKSPSAPARIPVVVVSGQEHQAQALALGADDYLIKPIPAWRLVESLSRLVSPTNR